MKIVFNIYLFNHETYFVNIINHQSKCNSFKYSTYFLTDDFFFFFIEHFELNALQSDSYTYSVYYIIIIHSTFNRYNIFRIHTWWIKKLI